MDKKQKPVDKEQKPKKKSMEEYIDEAAQKSAEKVLILQRRDMVTNHYRAMEDCLRAYPKRMHLMQHPEEFEFFPTGHSKDISIAPPPGTGVVDKIEAAVLFTEARKKKYVHELSLLHETEYAMAPFWNREDFIIIRMYYFNEDVHGKPRNGARPYTFEEIAEELKTIGINRSVRALRLWRTKLVREMTVMMFGVDGALSIESREQRQGQNEEGGADGQLCGPQ